jgi:hypothetical protein
MASMVRGVGEHFDIELLGWKRANQRLQCPGVYEGNVVVPRHQNPCRG